MAVRAGSGIVREIRRAACVDEGVSAKARGYTDERRGSDDEPDGATRGQANSTTETERFDISDETSRRTATALRPG